MLARLGVMSQGYSRFIHPSGAWGSSCPALAWSSSSLQVFVQVLFFCRDARKRLPFPFATKLRAKLHFLGSFLPDLCWSAEGRDLERASCSLMRGRPRGSVTSV